MASSLPGTSMPSVRAVFRLITNSNLVGSVARYAGLTAALANFLTKKAPYKGPGADSEEKHEPASDIDTAGWI